MKHCEKCKASINDENVIIFQAKVLCEDCFIDAQMPKMSKALYNNDSDFMQRLQNSYSVRKQQFH